jgi:FkbM family methyltransferase
MSITIKSLINRASKRLVYPLVPDHQKLPFLFHLEQFTADNETVLDQLESIAVTCNNAIDVGSNIGLYTYAMSRVFENVHSFEINPNLSHLLNKSQIKNVRVYKYGLSSEPGVAQFYIPKVDGQKLVGWGSLDKTNCPNAEELIEIKVQLATLDSFELQNISFIKIDVEGHEVEVLKGAMNTIHESRPTMLVEIKEKNEPDMHNLSCRINYHIERIVDVIPTCDGSQEDHILRPKEQTS